MSKQRKQVVPFSVSEASEIVRNWMLDVNSDKTELIDYLSYLSECPNVEPESNPIVVLKIKLDERYCRHKSKHSIRFSWYLVRLFFSEREFYLGEIGGKHSEIYANIETDCDVRFSRGDLDEQHEPYEYVEELAKDDDVSFFRNLIENFDSNVDHLLESVGPVINRDADVISFIEFHSLKEKVANVFQETRLEFPKVVYFYFATKSSNPSAPTGKVVVMFEHPIEAAIFSLEPREINYYDSYSRVKMTVTADMILSIEETEDYTLQSDDSRRFARYDEIITYDKSLFTKEELKGRLGVQYYMDKLSASKKQKTQ